MVGIPGYENSINGHAQMLGATHLYDNGDGTAAAINRAADALRADGGSFQANHPAYRIESPFDSCDDTGPLHWGYGYGVKLDTLEVWNPTSSMAYAQRYWECWLDRGAHLAATGGSDSHWASLSAVQGVGYPTTWVFAADGTPNAILAGLRAGRTTISRVPPGDGGLMLLLEADTKRNGTWQGAIGDTVRPGTPMRIVGDGLPAAGTVEVRANGQTLLEQPLLPGGEIRFPAPSAPGWVRATLYLSAADLGTAPGCDANGESISTCADDIQVAALTSPIYVGR